MTAKRYHRAVPPHGQLIQCHPVLVIIIVISSLSHCRNLEPPLLPLLLLLLLLATPANTIGGHPTPCACVGDAPLDRKTCDCFACV